MGYIFSSVPGEPGSLVFKFNGQFALKNYNVEIVNGNRLKVTSAQNELFSLLEVDVTEVEINGMIYSDANAAQVALQSLVFSDEIPVILSADDRAAIMAGFQGSINKLTPKPTKAGFYLCEESGIYTKINNLEALEHYITFFVFTGVIWSAAKIKIPGSSVSDTFDSTNAIDPQAAQQINNWLSTQVEGGEAGGTSSVTEEIGSFDKNIGINLVGNDSDSMDFTGLPASFVQCRTNYNSNDLITSDRIVKNAHINLSVGGFYKLCIGTWDGALFHPNWVSDVLTGVAGWNSVAVNRKLKPNEIIGSTGVHTGSAARIRFAENGAVASNRLAQYSTQSGNSTFFPFGSYYSIWFEIHNIDYLQTSTGEFNLKKSASRIINDFASNNYKSSFLITEGSTSANSETSQLLGYAINKLNNSVPYFLDKIEVRAQTSGSYRLVIGFIDQWNKLIEKKVKTVFLNAGVNTVTINDIIQKDSVIGFKLPSIFPVNNAAGVAANLFVSTDYGSTLSAVAGSSLPIKLFLREYIASNIATKTELSAVNTDINSVANQFVKDGKKVKLIFENNGTVKFEYSAGYSKTLFMGNSITLSVPDTTSNPNWWGTWGMAASEKNKDYCHIYLSKMRELNPAATVNPVNISLWEYIVSTAISSANYTFDYSSLDIHFADNPQVIFLKIGENVSWNQYFKNRFRDLIEHIILKNPTAIIKVCGVFWANSNIDSDMSVIAAEKGKQFIPLSQLDVPGSRSYIGAVVKGDDGQDHTVKIAGVAAHPGDAGMATIGNACFNSLGL